MRHTRPHRRNSYRRARWRHRRRSRLSGRPREQERPYLVACPNFLRNAAAFMLETGLRRKGLIGLQWQDIHWQPVGNAKRGYIAVRGTKSMPLKLRNFVNKATCGAR
jgi:integrase